MEEGREGKGGGGCTYLIGRRRALIREAMPVPAARVPLLGNCSGEYSAGRGRGALFRRDTSDRRVVEVMMAARALSAGIPASPFPPSRRTPPNHRYSAVSGTSTQPGPPHRERRKAGGRRVSRPLTHDDALPEDPPRRQVAGRPGRGNDGVDDRIRKEWAHHAHSSLAGRSGRRAATEEPSCGRGLPSVGASAGLELNPPAAVSGRCHGGERTEVGRCRAVTMGCKSGDGGGATAGGREKGGEPRRRWVRTGVRERG
jgi:hypothetical protein